MYYQTKNAYKQNNIIYIVKQHNCQTQLI